MVNTGSEILDALKDAQVLSSASLHDTPEIKTRKDRILQDWLREGARACARKCGAALCRRPPRVVCLARDCKGKGGARGWGLWGEGPQAWAAGRQGRGGTPQPVTPQGGQRIRGGFSAHCNDCLLGFMYINRHKPSKCTEIHAFYKHSAFGFMGLCGFLNKMII